MFLYILPSAQHNFFKIGVSETHQRIFYLNSIYAFDMGQAFAIELEDAELIKSMENYLLKLTAKYPCKTFYSRSNYTGKTFPGRTELRDCSALDHVVLAIYRFIEFHSRDIKVVRFFYHTCPECAALHQKYEYVEALNIPCLKEMREIIDEYYQKRYGGQMQKELPPAPGPTAR